MAKSQKTIEIEKFLIKEHNKLGTFCCPEVKIGIGNDQRFFGGINERVDFIVYSTDGLFRCFEIKVSESDLKSKSALSFYGDYNYLILPEELYNKIKDKPFFKKKYNGFSGIGIQVYKNNHIEVKQKAKKKSVGLGVKTLLMESMLRSLEREARKYWKSYY